MNDRDELIRGKLLDRLTAVGVDARNLVVEVAAGTVTVHGTVPTHDERDRAMEALIGAHLLEISVWPVAPVAPVDSADGRGRSRGTGTSAGSAHQSRHQTDPT